MKETGVIREIKGKLVVIAPDRSAVCFGCMNQECKPGGGLLSAENSLGLPLETGQTVQVEARAVSLVAQAAAAVLPPVLGFPAGFVLMRRLFPAAGEASAAFAGIAVLFAVAFIVYKARKKHPAAKEFVVTKTSAV